MLARKDWAEMDMEILSNRMYVVTGLLKGQLGRLLVPVEQRKVITHFSFELAANCQSIIGIQRETIPLGSIPESIEITLLGAVIIALLSALKLHHGISKKEVKLEATLEDTEVEMAA